jgi:hypothetical protein
MQLIPNSMAENAWEALSNAAIDWKVEDNG